MAGGCNLCPKGCGVDRMRSSGFCGASAEVEVSSVVLHRGEEPPLNPIVNIFFSHCNLHCVYCQNHEISGQAVAPQYIHYRSVEAIADRASVLLDSSNLLGLVTATHYADHIPALLEALHRRGKNPTVVYNSSGYESVDTLRSLEGLVDIYLPDFKYADSELAQRYSHAADYPQVASEALKEMIRQVGVGLKTDDDGTAYRGLIVRHLVLPGHIDNSLAVLEKLADLTSPLPPFDLHLSLMAQYYPPATLAEGCDLRRPLTPDEYRTVSERFRALGFDGWLQELAAESHYRPDFTHPDNPFEA